MGVATGLPQPYRIGGNILQRLAWTSIVKAVRYIKAERKNIWPLYAAIEAASTVGGVILFPHAIDHRRAASHALRLISHLMNTIEAKMMGCICSSLEFMALRLSF
jgi:hypothetical protein